MVAVPRMPTACAPASASNLVFRICRGCVPGRGYDGGGLEGCELLVLRRARALPLPLDNDEPGKSPMAGGKGRTLALRRTGDR